MLDGHRAELQEHVSSVLVSSKHSMLQRSSLLLKVTPALSTQQLVATRQLLGLC